MSDISGVNCFDLFTYRGHSSVSARGHILLPHMFTVKHFTLRAYKWNRVSGKQPPLIPCFFGELCCALRVSERERERERCTQFSLDFTEQVAALSSCFDSPLTGAVDLKLFFTLLSAEYLLLQLH